MSTYFNFQTAKYARLQILKREFGDARALCGTLGKDSVVAH